MPSFGKLLSKGLDLVTSGSFLGPVIGGLAGGLLGRESAKDQAAHSERVQREFAQHGIQWKVEDAKAAGWHPLYALCASTPGFSPATFVDPIGPAMAQAGQDIGRAVSATSTAHQRRLQQLQLELLGSQIGESDARRQLLLSQVQNRATNPPFPEQVDPSTGIVGQGAGSGGEITYQLPQEGGRYGQENRFLFKPTEITAVNPNDRASVAGPPGAHWQTYALDSGSGGRRPLYIDLPAGASPAEAWESVGESAVLLGLMLKRNSEKYGQEWVVRFQQEFPSLWDRLSRQAQETGGDLRRWFRNFEQQLLEWDRSRRP